MSHLSPSERGTSPRTTKADTWDPPVLGRPPARSLTVKGAGQGGPAASRRWPTATQVLGSLADKHFSSLGSLPVANDPLTKMPSSWPLRRWMNRPASSLLPRVHVGGGGVGHRVHVSECSGRGVAGLPTELCRTAGSPPAPLPSSALPGAGQALPVLPPVPRGRPEAPLP